MSDINSSLPIRTEQDGDVVVKVGDRSTPSQQMAVDTDGKVDAKLSDGAGTAITSQANGAQQALDVGINVAGVQVDPRDVRAIDSATDSIEAVQDTHDNLNANANIQVGNADVENGNPVPVSDAGGSLTVDAVDLDIRDIDHATDSIKVGDGVDFLAVNADGSINVVPQEDPGTERVVYNTAAAVAGGGTSNHDVTVTNAAKLFQVLAAASGKMRIEVQIETGAATNTFNTVMVGFNSTSNPIIDLRLAKYASIPAGARVRVIRRNGDLLSQDLYSTVVVLET